MFRISGFDLFLGEVVKACDAVCVCVRKKDREEVKIPLEFTTNILVDIIWTNTDFFPDAVHNFDVVRKVSSSVCLAPNVPE